MAFFFSDIQAYAVFLSTALAIYAFTLIAASIVEALWDSWRPTLRPIFRLNLRTRLKGVTDPMANLGEKYFARTLQDYLHSFRAAGGGGWLTAFTVTLKYVISWAKLPLLLEASLTSVNYVGTFMLIQGFGFRLATKQPSLLAAALVRKIHRPGIWRETLAVTRALASAMMGNLLVVLVTATAFQWAHLFFTDRGFMTSENATQVLDSLKPHASASLGYAVFTGALLWLASLAAGWFGASKSPGFSARWASIAFNIALGVLLGATPALGMALGLPLDVRHFTLSGGGWALATGSLGIVSAWKAGAASAFCGVLLIGILNVGTSFVLAFVTALSANGIPFGKAWRLLVNARDLSLHGRWEYLFPAPELSGGTGTGTRSA